MKVEPYSTNISCGCYSEWSWWTKKVAEDLVLRWWAQGGTEYQTLQPWMIESFVGLLENMGDEITAIHDKAFKTISATRKDS
jgi:hypothetical protein